ncbi:hypothetical protein XELAEV_18002791mg [Xenopus laevis]|nr:hypothetical protein XELAEV_18002791mg [Xenopus laevis]
MLLVIVHDQRIWRRPKTKHPNNIQSLSRLSPRHYMMVSRSQWAGLGEEGSIIRERKLLQNGEEHLGKILQPRENPNKRQAAEIDLYET